MDAKKLSAEQARSMLEAYFAGQSAPGKRTLATQWIEAIAAFEKGDYNTAIAVFSSGSQAKMSYNLGIVFMKQHDYESAIQAFTKAIETDKFFALSHFQRGYCHFMVKEYGNAIKDYNSALQLLRDNDSIDYTKLGLNGVKLQKTEIMYNQIICEKHAGNDTVAREVLQSAFKIDATRYSVHTNFVALENDLWKAKGSTDSVPISVGLSLFSPPRSAHDVGGSTILAENLVLSPREDLADPTIKNLRRSIEAKGPEQRDKIYYMLSLLSKTRTPVPQNKNLDISGKEDELTGHVIEMSKLYFDADVKVMLDRHARELERTPEKRGGIWRTWCQLLEEQSHIEGLDVEVFRTALVNSKALMAAVKSYVSVGQNGTNPEEDYLRQIFHYICTSKIESDDLFNLVRILSFSCAQSVRLAPSVVKFVLDFKHITPPSDKDVTFIFPSFLHALQLLHANMPSLQILHCAREDCAPLLEQLDALAQNSSKEVSRNQSDLQKSQESYAKSTDSVDLAIQETTAKLEKLRSEIRDVEEQIARRSEDKSTLQSSVENLKEERRKFVEISQADQFEFQKEKAETEDKILKFTQTRNAIQKFTRKIRMLTFNEADLCLKGAEALLQTEEGTVELLETKLANYQQSAQMLSNEPDILAKLSEAFHRYVAILQISMQHTSSILTALQAYETQSNFEDLSDLNRKSVIFDVYELMSTYHDDVIIAKSLAQQRADLVVAVKLKNRAAKLAERQKLLLENNSS